MTDGHASNPTVRQWRWDQPVPLRWLLIHGLPTDEDVGPDVAVAVCVDIDGVVVDDPPPGPAERYTLLGCAPKGRLRAAVDGTGPAWLDHLVLDALHHPDRPCSDWAPHFDSRECREVLVDLTVVGWRPSSLDATLLDIDLQGHPFEPRYPERDLATPPDAVGYLLTCEDEEPLGECQEVAGVFWPRPQPPVHPVTLRGCQPEPLLRAAIDALHRAAGNPSGTLGPAIEASIRLVTVDGFAGALCLSLEGSVVAARASTLGRGLVDVTFDTGVETIPVSKYQILERWRAGPPTQRNQWASYGRELRDMWNCLPWTRRGHQPDQPAGTTYHLDGRYVTDITGFYCAIGEAVNGPGGHLGGNLDDLIDSMRGGFGVTKPFRLVWHDSEVARTHMVTGFDPHRWAPAFTFDYLLQTLAEEGIEVHLH